jgi:thymidylate synthase
MELEVRNVEEAYHAGMMLLNSQGKLEDSRNGPVIVYPEPVLTIYNNPMERVLAHVGRDANPFFHIFEAMWMLCGRRDVAFLARFNDRMLTYSDDGQTLWGAYGHRWRFGASWEKDPGTDQLDQIVHQLKADMKSRRAVLAMWTSADIFVTSKDIPCNTHCYFRVIKDTLDMTVSCRSNDIIWGAYGANSVHFSVLQEYMAAGLGIKTGRMYQFSNNYHAYIPLFKEKMDSLELENKLYPHYPPTVIVTDYWSFIHELKQVMKWVEDTWRDFDFVPPTVKWKNPFMMDLILMGRAYSLYKQGEIFHAKAVANKIRGYDWKAACTQWLDRRKNHGK